jgi:hypothetical protein
MHTHLGKELMANNMKQRKIPLKRFIECLKLYLAYERWVTEPHSRAQVRRSYKLLGELIKMIKQCFPREKGWGWNLPNEKICPSKGSIKYARVEGVSARDSE